MLGTRSPRQTTGPRAGSVPAGGGRNTGRFAHDERLTFDARNPELPNVEPRSWMIAAGAPQAVAPERSNSACTASAASLSSRECTSPALSSRSPRQTSRWFGGFRSPCCRNTARRLSASNSVPPPQLVRAVGQARDGVFNLPELPALVRVGVREDELAGEMRLGDSEELSRGLGAGAVHGVGRAVRAVDRDRIDAVGREAERPEEPGRDHLGEHFAVSLGGVAVEVLHADCPAVRRAARELRRLAAHRRGAGLVGARDSVGRVHRGAGSARDSRRAFDDRLG